MQLTEKIEKPEIFIHLSIEKPILLSETGKCLIRLRRGFL